MERFLSRVTVGTVIERDGKILVVREYDVKGDTSSRVVIGQPAGHIEENESIVDGAVREVLEETGYAVRITSIIGIYHQKFSKHSATRYSFVAELLDEPTRPITDPDIIEAIWMPIEELKARRSEWRSWSATETFDAYLAGARFPIDVLHWADHTLSGS